MMMIITSSILLMITTANSLNLYILSAIIMPLLLYTLSFSTIVVMVDTQFIYFSTNLSSYIDFLSLSLILMSLWLLLPIFNSVSLFKNKKKSFSMKFYTLFTLMIFISSTFLTTSMLMFYIMFESTILPTIMLILYWGYQPERLNAFLYMTLYTILASLPLILVILSMSDYSMFMMSPPFKLKSPILYFMSMIAFLVKIPMYTLHLWLPKAHVEAPIEGSMILAGILLKLGVYGMLRLMTMNKLLIINIIIMVISMVGASITSIICLQQSDAKSLIAYSSVAHMGLGTAAFTSSSNLGKMSSIIMLIAHGLISPMLFYNINALYETMKSRSIFLFSGLKTITPFFCLSLFLGLILNSGVPPSLNFMSEMLCIMTLMSYSSSLILPVMIMMLFAMIWSAMLYIKFTSMSPQSSSKSSSSKLISSTTPPALILPTILTTFFILNL